MPFSISAGFAVLVDCSRFDGQENACSARSLATGPPVSLKYQSDRLPPAMRWFDPFFRSVIFRFVMFRFVMASPPGPGHDGDLNAHSSIGGRWTIARSLLSASTSWPCTASLHGARPLRLRPCPCAPARQVAWPLAREFG